MEEYMSQKLNPKRPQKTNVTVIDVNRVLEVGCLLFLVLTAEEITKLHKILSGDSPKNGIGNAGVT